MRTMLFLPDPLLYLPRERKRARNKSVSGDRAIPKRKRSFVFWTLSASEASAPENVSKQERAWSVSDRRGRARKGTGARV